jgi:2'-5' RNA ligase
MPDIVKKIDNVLQEEYSTATIQIRDIPKDIVNKIRDIQLSIKENDIETYTGEDESNWVENGIQKLIHLTILYGVEEDELDKIKVIDSTYPEFEIKAKGISYFDNEDSSVCVIECESERLTEFHNELKEKVSNKDSYPEYKPHITVAYLKPGERVEFEFGDEMEFRINDIEMSINGGKDFINV